MTPAQLTVERIFDTPNLSGDSITHIDWSPDGRYLSYVFGHRDGGSAEIRAFDREERRSATLFNLAHLSESAAATCLQAQALDKLAPGHDGPSHRLRADSLMDYQWFPGSDRLLLSVSGHVPQIVDLSKAEHAPITTADIAVRDAQVSPDGRFVSFVCGWDLGIMDLRNGGRVYPISHGSSEALRTATGDSMGDLLVGFTHWWSPDSAALAYIQTDERQVPMYWYANLTSRAGQNRPERYPQPGDPTPAIVLKVTRGSRTTLIDTRAWPGYYMARVKWLPDARHIALQMLNRAQNELQVVLADSVTGATRTILTETDPHWINIVDDWQFFADSPRFLWSSERGAQRHLYLYDLHGTQLAQLTTGPEACVSVRGLDEKRGAVFYQVYPAPYTDSMLNRVDFSEESGAYRVSEPRTITTEPGSHFAHFSPDFGCFGALFSTATRPPCLFLCDSAGERLASVEANPVPSLEKYALQAFRFDAHRPAQLGIPSDSMAIHSKLLEPVGRKQGERYPVIVYVYGGPMPGGFGLARNVLNSWRPAPELWMQMMAQNGFGVFSLDNRGANAIVRGHDFETPIHRQLGHVELADQLAGVEYLKSLDWVDAQRIGILGGSFGGFMTLNAMLRANNAFRAGCAFAAVSDWREYDAVYTERYMGAPDDNAAGYDETSIRGYADQLDNALLLVHGGSDPNVHVQHTFELIEALVRAGKPYDLLIYPNQVHMSFFGVGQSAFRLWTRITEFFHETLT